ncbi:uncharacterized protein (TIGR00255 family) [Enterococcus sp. PF1-24]|uniref:YicC/YloC family endoribonuclease n=1 Tax=unclassified Enterococcus TaxID=2608891 RepID=UPI0024764B6B|nr:MULTISPECIES: YicC/YloC family endoribonuclease [unclassified Enterococcus]MDH6364306.1 uncharacterized protein (TIGR00255 family) [Enterococcus sp. PFB1-1]MDH6401335.1 uncharacterized protein (TIGR00255 family) [Enterococcus sp. PF1-24]
MKSMTGFGKATLESEIYLIDVEIKSVNHRFLDMQIRAPRQINPFELTIRQEIKENIQRGRLEVFVNLKEKASATKEVVVQWPLINSLLAELAVGMPESSSEKILKKVLPTLVTQDAYITIEEQQGNVEELENLVITAVKQAATNLNQSRAQEGQGIQAVLEENRQMLLEVINNLATFNESYEADFQQRFESKLRQWLGDKVTEDRLLTEIALLIERGDIHEELDRLNIHLQSLAQMLEKTTPIGRELDFLIQEMNREVNTIGSKSTNIEIKNMVVQLKTILEKIREQIQNVE